MKQKKLNDYWKTNETSNSLAIRNTEKVKRNKIKELYLQGLNGNRISHNLGISKTHAYRIIAELKEIEPEIELQKRNLNNLHTQSRGEGARNVHAQRLKVYVHHMSDKYKRHPNITIDEFAPGVNVQCSGKIIYIRSNGLKFYGDTEVKAMHKSMKHWKRILLKIEEKFNILIFKRGAPAFEITYHEWETSDSVVARDSENRESHIWKVYHTEDNKLRMSIDWSDKIPSHEMHHFRDNHQDSITFNQFLNDILDNPQAPMPSEIAKTMQATLELHKETTEGLKAVIKIMQLGQPNNQTPTPTTPTTPTKTFYHE